MKKRVKKLCKIALLLVFIGSLCVVGVNAYVAYEGDKLMADEVPEGAQYDCVLILGAGVYADGTPSPMLLSRLRKGYRLYESGAARKILVSGDNGQIEYNEVEAMKNYLVERGVPEEDIFMDHAGFSTYDSMYRAKEVFEVKSAIVVTQRYHEYRAVYIADQLGIDVLGVSTPDIKFSGRVFREMREVLARDKDFVKCIIKPEPTYLGEKIDIAGDGRDTRG